MACNYAIDVSLMCDAIFLVRCGSPTLLKTFLKTSLRIWSEKTWPLLQVSFAHESCHEIKSKPFIQFGSLPSLSYVGLTGKGIPSQGKR